MTHRLFIISTALLCFAALGVGLTSGALWYTYTKDHRVSTIERVKHTKRYYDRVPTEETALLLLLGATPEVSKTAAPHPVKPFRADDGCKRGRTRNAAGICGRW